MLRQNRSEGSSTSRSFAKTALLRARRKTFQFSDEQFARHIFFTEPLFLIPSVQTEVPESGSTEVQYFFRRNHFSSCRPAEPVHLEAAREVGFARGPRHSFRGNHFSSFLPVETGAAGCNDVGLTGDRPSCLGNHFPSFRWVHGRPLAAISLQQFFL